MSALILGGCFILSAVLVPRSVHLPRWVEFELVIAAWWVVWLIALSVLLYYGHGISDDFVTGTFSKSGGRDRMSAAGDVALNLGDVAGDAAGGLLSEGAPGCAEAGGEGCAAALVIASLVLALWVVVELTLPVLALICYGLIRGMLARVVNDKHDCKGHASLALAWGGIWAAGYTAPLALLVWITHTLHAR